MFKIVLNVLISFNNSNFVRHNHLQKFQFDYIVAIKCIRKKK